MHFFTKLCIKTVIFFPPLLDRKCLVWHFLFISWHNSRFETSKQPSREEALSDSLAAQCWGDPAPALAHPQPTHFLHLFLSVPFVARRFMAPVTVLCQQELPQQAQTSVWPLAHCGWPETGAPSRVRWPQYRPRPSPSTAEVLPRQKAHPRVTKRGVPLGWSSDNTELKLGWFSFGQRFNFFFFFYPLSFFLYMASPLRVNLPAPLFSCGAVLLSAFVPAGGGGGSGSVGGRWRWQSTPPGSAGSAGWSRKKGGKKMVWPRLLPRNDTSWPACPQQNSLNWGAGGLIDVCG